MSKHGTVTLIKFNQGEKQKSNKYISHNHSKAVQNVRSLNATLKIKLVTIAPSYRPIEGRTAHWPVRLASKFEQYSIRTSVEITA